MVMVNRNAVIRNIIFLSKIVKCTENKIMTRFIPSWIAIAIRVCHMCSGFLIILQSTEVM